MKNLIKTDTNGPISGIKFDEHSWGVATEGFVTSAKGLHPASFDSIIKQARELAKLTHSNKTGGSHSGGAASGVQEVFKDRCAMLVNSYDDED